MRKYILYLNALRLPKFFFHITPILFFLILLHSKQVNYWKTINYGVEEWFHFSVIYDMVVALGFRHVQCSSICMISATPLTQYSNFKRNIYAVQCNHLRPQRLVNHKHSFNLWAIAGYSNSAIFRKDNESYNIYICDCVRWTG